MKLCAILLFGCGLMGMQAQNMYVKESNGTQTVYALSGIQKMTFSSGDLIVTKTDNTQGIYALNALQYLSFYNSPVSIKEENAESLSILAYPNPVNDELTVDLRGIKNKNGKLHIFNIEGKLMKTQLISGSDIIILDMSQFPMGMYFCQFNNGIEIKTIKIIKQ